MIDRLNIAIIGAGAAGLAAAWDFANAGHSVRIYEAGSEVGGLAAGFKDAAWDWTLEKFYHHWFSNDDAILGLLDEMGLRDKVIFQQPTTSYWHPRGPFALDKPVLPSALLSRAVNVLRIPGLPLLAKLRFGLVAFLLTKYRDGITLEKHTADAWMRRWVGRRAYETLWRPMLIGKMSEHYDRVNMAWMWARLYKRTASLGTYEGGFQAALEAMAAKVRAKGVDLCLNTPVQRITPRAGGSLAVEAGEQGGDYDRVLVTAGPGLLLKIAPDLSADYAEQVRGLRSIGAVIVVAALKHELMADGTYWLNLPAVSPDRAQNPFPFLALVEHTHFLPREHYGGDHLIYMGDYVAPEHEYFQLDEAALAERFMAALPKVNPAFSPEWVRKWWVFRAPYAQPVPYVNHSQHIPPIETPIADLYWASMSQVYPWDRGTNYAVEIGRQAARMMMGEKA